jgi:hypothetical protein
MSELTQLLSALGQGDPHAAGRLLPLVYDELRKLAAQRMPQEQPGQTLQPTALVQEAYLRPGEGTVGFVPKRHPVLPQPEIIFAAGHPPHLPFFAPLTLRPLLNLRPGWRKTHFFCDPEGRRCK